MRLEDIIKFRLKRINPFQGLVIDADTWRDAHQYHRDQQRLHVLTFHNTGIVEGLEVRAADPPDLSVTIQPGMAIDPEGNVIIVPQPQRYQLQRNQAGTVYLVIQFREVPAEPYQPPQGGQPTRLLEAYRIQEREKLSNEPYLELARIDFDPAPAAIKDAREPSRPGKNEINLSSRKKASVVIPAVGAGKIATPAPPPPASVKESVSLGHLVLGENGNDLHAAGWQNLVREINRTGNAMVNLEEGIPLETDISKYALISLTGSGGFELSPAQQTALSKFLETGGIIFGEGDSEEQGEASSRGAKEFGLAFNKLAGQLKCKMEVVPRTHLLLSAAYVFSEVPPGAEPAMLLEGNHMIYSGSDYGCAWQGGHRQQPLARDVIRSSFEMGANIVSYAQMVKKSGRSPR